VPAEEFEEYKRKTLLLEGHMETLKRDVSGIKTTNTEMNHKLEELGGKVDAAGNNIGELQKNVDEMKEAMKEQGKIIELQSKLNARMQEKNTAQVCICVKISHQFYTHLCILLYSLWTSRRRRTASKLRRRLRWPQSDPLFKT
jgi:uncharacterized protein YoxC